MVNAILYALLVAVVAYLIGAIPTGYICVKTKTGQDIRTIGSGSTGATNVKRVLGTPWFFIVLLLDGFKGILTVATVAHFMSQYYWGIYPVIASIFVIIGHSKPIYLGFKGGKSVACGIGTILALNFWVGLIITATFALITYFSKYVSLGSIIALSISPFVMWYFHSPLAYVAYCGLGALYIIYLHRSNIGRLIRGEENKVR